MTPSTPKTHVLMANAAPVAVLFYRRSSLTTYCLLLDYERKGRGFRDRLEVGSRFYGRLFPERCHVSPDGQLLVYFAMRGRRTDGRSDPSTWTAVCTPPRLTAHLFFPNGSTWGGGGMFLPNQRLAIFDAAPQGAGPEYIQFRGYKIVHDTKSLRTNEAAMLKERYEPPLVTKFPKPSTSSQKLSPVLVRMTKSAHLGNYDRYDYRLETGGGDDIEGAEDVCSSNWAGWDNHGRLVVAAGRHIRIYEAETGRPLRKPMRILDLEDAIQ